MPKYSTRWEVAKITKTTTSNYLSVAAPGNTFNARISADSDVFARNDVDALGSGLELHTHANGLGLPVNSIPSGGLTVTAGNVGIGGAAGTDKGLNITGNLFAAATSDYGIFCDPTFPSTATTEGSALLARVNTAAVAFTVTSAAGLHVLNAIKGAGSAMTSLYGVLVDIQSGSATNNYGIYINTPSGGSGDNMGLVALGDVSLGAITQATNATTGFMYVNGGTGAPTGVPARYGAGAAAGKAAMYYDLTNNKLYFYNGSWKGVLVA